MRRAIPWRAVRCVSGAPLRGAVLGLTLTPPVNWRATVRGPYGDPDWSRRQLRARRQCPNVPNYDPTENSVSASKRAIIGLLLGPGRHMKPCCGSALPLLLLPRLLVVR